MELSRYKGRSLKEWATYCNIEARPASLEHVEAKGDSFVHFIMSIIITLRGRKVVEGRLGRIYLVPKTARVNDLMCVLSGCATPMMLRKSQG